jgi:GTPase SAR1 family protein
MSKYNNILKKIFISDKFINEQFEDNIEYKWKLDNKNNVGLKKLITQMLWRLNEGKERYGIHEAHYILGIYDSGDPGNLSLEDLNKTIDVFKGVVNKANCYIYEDHYFTTNSSNMYYAYIRKTPDDKILNQKYLILVGNSGVGKSTLLSSLCNDIKDNGLGYSRNYVLKHKHEKILGKSQTFKKEVLGIDYDNNILNYSNSSIEDIYLCDNIINIFDTPGNLSYYINSIYVFSSIIPNMIFYLYKSKSKSLSEEAENKFIVDYCRYFNVDLKYINIFDLGGEQTHNLDNNLDNIIFSNITHLNLNQIHDQIKNIKMSDHIQNTCVLNNCFRILDKYNINETVSGIQCIGNLTTNTTVYLYNCYGEYIKCSIISIYKNNTENKHIYPKECGEIKLSFDNNETFVTKQLILTNNIIHKSCFKDIINIKLLNYSLTNKINNSVTLVDGFVYLIFIGNMYFYGTYLKNKIIFDKKVLIQNNFAIIYPLSYKNIKDNIILNDDKVRTDINTHDLILVSII